MSLPPTSIQVWATRSPQLNTEMFVVPPPISRLAATQPYTFEKDSVPAPRPAMIDSRSGPAVATTKSPANSESFSVMSLAFSLSADSPVIMTAPLSTSSGVIPAFLYSVSMISLILSPSSCSSEIRGVIYTGLL